MSEYVKLEYAGWVHCPMNGEKQVTGKLKNADDSLFTVNLQGIKEQKSKLDLQPTCNQLATNLISRQGAIEAIEERFFAGTVADINPSWRLLHEIIESLPSVGSTPVCEDAISRAMAIDLVSKYHRAFIYDSDVDELLVELETLPPVESQRPKGEWQLIDHLWECNRCHYRLTLQNKSEPTNFCPNCGADMKGADDE